MLLADNQVVIAQHKEEIECKIKKLKRKYQFWEIKTNLRKTEHICICGNVADVNIKEEKIKDC